MQASSDEWDFLMQRLQSVLIFLTLFETTLPWNSLRNEWILFKCARSPKAESFCCKTTARRGDYADACKIRYFQLVTLHEAALAVLPPPLLGRSALILTQCLLQGLTTGDSKGCQMGNVWLSYFPHQALQSTCKQLYNYMENSALLINIYGNISCYTPGHHGHHTTSWILLKEAKIIPLQDTFYRGPFK